MSTGETSSLIRRAHAITGQPDQPVKKAPDPALKPMTGAQLAFRPSAPPRQPGQTGTQQAFKPGGSGNTPALKPGTGTQPAFRPTGNTGVTPAFTPTTGSGSQPAIRRGPTSTTPAYQPSAPRPPASTPPAHEPPEGEEAPVFDVERLQAQIRTMSITESALGRATGKAAKPNKAPTSSAEDTFVKRKMQQAESKVPDFSLDDDLG